MRRALLIVALLLAGCSDSSASPSAAPTEETTSVATSFTNPVYDQNFPDPGALLVDAVSPDRISRLAFDHGVVLYEIAAEAANLEDVFFDLTEVAS